MLIQPQEKHSLCRRDIREIMEYKVVIQENLCNGSIYIHNYTLEAEYFNEALQFRALHFHSDCVFIVEYSTN